MTSTRVSSFRATAFLVSDLIATCATYLMALMIRHPIVGTEGVFRFKAIDEYLLLLAVIVGIWALVFSFVGLYTREGRLSRTATAILVLQGLVVSHSILGMLLFYAKVRFLSRAVIALFFVLNFGGILLGRILVERIAHGRERRRTLVIGASELADRLARSLAREEGHEIAGFVLDPESADAAVPSAVPVLGRLEELQRIIETNQPLDEVAIALPGRRREALEPMVCLCEDRGLVVREAIEPLGRNPRMTTLEQIGGVAVLTISHAATDIPRLAVKRIIDIVGAVVGLSITAILFPFIALGIKLSSRGPIFYSQERVGLNGRIFRLYKFRTMVDGAHAQQKDLMARNEAMGPNFKITQDPRITPIGRFLRKTSLDEFPQFWNVLIGEMSLVGPRPFDVREVEKHKWHYHKRCGMRPGLTCIWQARGRSEISDFEQIVAMDEEYIRNWSLHLDFRLLVETIPAVLKGTGAK